MKIFKTKPHIDFLKKRYLFFGISGALMIVSVLVIPLRGGLNLGIDFTGGTVIQVSFNNTIPSQIIRKALAQGGVGNADIQSIPEHNGFIIRIRQEKTTGLEEISNMVLNSLKTAVPENTVTTLERVEYVGPAVGQYLMRQAMWAVLLSLLGIIVYVGFRFRNLVWGVAGVVAIMHDVFSTVGVLTLFNREITITVIAALLTIAGYSINDTIVIFDRMRERTKLYRKESLYEAINNSLNDTLSRTLLTAFTVFLAVVSLYLFGGEVLRDFSLALLWGVFVGCYSTLAIAVPLVYEWKTRQARPVTMKTAPAELRKSK